MIFLLAMADWIALRSCVWVKENIFLIRFTSPVLLQHRCIFLLAMASKQALQAMYMAGRKFAFKLYCFAAALRSFYSQWKAYKHVRQCMGQMEYLAFVVNFTSFAAAHMEFLLPWQAYKLLWEIFFLPGHCIANKVQYHYLDQT